MTGPEALTTAQTAEIVGRIADRPITYHEETMEEAWASRRPTGAPDWEIRGGSRHTRPSPPERWPSSDAVERVAGHPRQALEPFLQTHPQLWKHLSGASG